MVPEGVSNPVKRAPVASKAAGAARRLVQQGMWWVTGKVPADLHRAPVRVSVPTDPMNSATAHAIRDVFETSGIMAELTGATVGPRIVLYEVCKHKGQSVEKILRLQREFEYAVGTPDVRIISPIPGKSAIGIEVPRSTFDPIPLSSITGAFANHKAHPLLAAIGKDIEGRSVVANLAEMPHLLIAGATGAGKSACLNSLLVSIIERTTPEQVRMILIDPKRVEFMPYDGLPHLLMDVVTDSRRAITALEWVVSEMEMRYEALEKARTRTIDEYNKTAERKYPYVLVVVDELADLVMVSKDDVEELIIRIAQKARACGIHLVLATQRPSADVVTGLITANIPSRLAFAVASGSNSDIILGTRGAEKLLGKGDGLFLPMGAMFPVRIQGPLVEDVEISAAVQAARAGVQVAPTQVALAESTPEDDPLMARAIQIVMESQTGSASALQRKLSIGFERANELLESMEARGIVGPARKGKPRAVLAQTEGMD